MSVRGSYLDDALRRAVDQSDVPTLLSLVQQVLQRASGGAELSSSVGATALCLMGQKQLAAKVAGYAFYEWLARRPDRSAVLSAVGVLGINALRKDASHATPAVRAAAVRVAAAAIGAAQSGLGGSSSSSELVSASSDVFERASVDTSAFVRRIAAAAGSLLPCDHNVTGEAAAASGASSVADSCLRTLALDSDPLVAVVALVVAHTDDGCNRRGTAILPVVTRELCLRLLDGVSSGAYPEFTQVSALQLACRYRLDEGDDDGLLYDLLDRLDPLLQAQDPCLALAAADAFSAYATHLPPAARQDAAVRLADACLRLISHPDQHVVSAALRWLAEQPDLERLAACFGAGGSGGALSLFYCKPADGGAVKIRKIDLLRRLAVLYRDTVADVADHLLAQMSSGGRQGNTDGTGAHTVRFAAMAAVASLSRLDEGCLEACRASVDQHLRSCGAATLASTIVSCHEIERLATPESLGRAFDVLTTSPAKDELLLRGDADVAAAAAWLAAECCTTRQAAPAVIASLVERAFPEAAAATAPSTDHSVLRRTSADGSLQLAVVSASLKCYFRRPSAASREVVGRVLSAAVARGGVVAKEQATLYYRLMCEDVDCCRALVLGADELGTRRPSDGVSGRSNEPTVQSDCPGHTTVS